MNALDVLLVALFASAALSGYRLGLLARAISWVGGLIGLGLSVFLVPWALGFAEGASTLTRLFIGIGVVITATSIMSAVAEFFGLRVRHRVHASPFGQLDKATGLVAGVASIVLILWMLLPAMANTPGTVAHQVRQSLVISWIEDITPPPPDVALALGRVVDQRGFPDVFADLRPAPVVGPPPSQVPVDPAIVATATDSTVNVEAFGCGNGFEGSGFVIAEGLVVTNAHVVAGANDIRLRRPDGVLVPATIRHSDRRADIALLDAPEIGRPPLSLRDPVVDEQAASIGYPGGQDTPRVAPAVVSDDRSTIGRDTEGNVVERRVLFLAARLQQGDSGSPVVAQDGAVVGVVFAVSPDDDRVAYALHPQEVRGALAATPNRSTGSCT